MGVNLLIGDVVDDARQAVAERNGQSHARLVRQLARHEPEVADGLGKQVSPMPAPCTDDPHGARSPR